MLYLVGGLFVLAVFYKKVSRLTLFCSGWFALNLLPKTPAMYGGNFMLDHWAYAVLPAILLPLAIFFNAQWNRRREKWRKGMGASLFPLADHVGIARSSERRAAGIG